MLDHKSQLTGCGHFNFSGVYINACVCWYMLTFLDMAGHVKLIINIVVETPKSRPDALFLFLGNVK